MLSEIKDGRQPYASNASNSMAVKFTNSAS